MGTESMASGFIALQKQSFNNFMDAMAIFQDQIERNNRMLARKMGIHEKIQEFVDQWRLAFKNGRDDFRNQINETYACMDEYWSKLEPQKQDFPSAN